ncbi:MAG TPA: hypothetical protein VGB91_14575 [Rhizomicrobium sp.]
MRMSAKGLLACAAMAATVAIATVPAGAESWRSCQGKITRAVQRYEAAADRYGRHSGRADEERYKVREIKRKCHDMFGQWWDPRGGRWNSDDDHRGDH